MIAAGRVAAIAVNTPEAGIRATLQVGTFDVADATSYTTGSFTPTANSSLLIFTGESILAGYAPRGVPSGGSLTYEEELTFTWGASPGVRRTSCWTALVGGSPSEMTITFTMNDSQGSGTTATSFAYAVIEVTDQHPTWLLNQIRFIGSTINGSSNAGGTSGTITSDSALDADNRPFSWWYHRANEAKTFRANWMELFDGNVATPAGGAEAQWRSDGHLRRDCRRGQPFRHHAAASPETGVRRCHELGQRQPGHRAHARRLRQR
jgi:hypothetical protein